VCVVREKIPTPTVRTNEILFVDGRRKRPR
jgi:hypothetical protein